MEVNEKMKGGISALQESAQQFSSKGEYDKAIAAWKKVLTVREDANIYNTIGDQYIKKGSMNEAVEFFNKAAGKFTADGFHQKAIAIYKKILNIVPFDVNALVSLADLHAVKGLAGNAASYYLKAAEKLSRDGDADMAIDIYNKMLQLSPSDISIKIKIAELWQSRGLTEKAANDYASIAEDYVKRDDFDLAVEFFSRAIGIDPQSTASYIGLSNLAEKKNNLEQAVEFALRALNLSKNNKDILSRYIQLAIKAGKTADAEHTLSKLIISSPSDISYKQLLSDIHIKEGRTEKAWEILLPGIDELLQDQNWDEAYGLLEPFRELFPAPVRQRLATVYRGKGDIESLTEELKFLAKIYENEGSVRKALGLYRELSELKPGDTAIREKIDDLELSAGLRLPSTPEITAREEAPDALQDKPAQAEHIIALNGTDYNSSAEEDYEFHYNSGIEYKRKGLLDDAIREFQIVAKDPEKALLSSKMIASCYMEKGAFVRAIAELNMLLESMSCDDEKCHDIKYDLAGAYMQNNDYSKSLEIYSDIRSKDPGYRDVQHKIDILKDLIEQSAGKQKTRKNRISYI